VDYSSKYLYTWSRQRWPWCILLQIDLLMSSRMEHFILKIKENQQGLMQNILLTGSIIGFHTLQQSSPSQMALQDIRLACQQNIQPSMRTVTSSNVPVKAGQKVDVFHSRESPCKVIYVHPEDAIIRCMA
jgi:hypothetical protein